MPPLPPVPPLRLQPVIPAPEVFPPSPAVPTVSPLEIVVGSFAAPAPAAPTEPPLLPVRMRLGAVQLPLQSLALELHAAKGEVARAAHILDPSFNLQQTSLLVEAHQKVLSAILERRDTIANLRRRADALSGKLAGAQRTYIEKTQIAKAAEETFNLKKSQEQGLIRQLRGKQSTGEKEEDLETYRRNLSEARCRLLNESLDLAEAKRKALGELAAAHAEAANETAKTQQLRDAILRTHDYCLECHQHVEEVKIRIKITKESVPKESSAAAAAEQQAYSVAKADRQRMLAETALLRAEVRRQEVGTIHAISMLRDAQNDLKALQLSVEKQVANIRSQIGVTKASRLELAETVGKTKGARLEDKLRRKGVQKQLWTLQRRLSSVAYGALKAENEAYQNELHQAAALVQESKTEEAKAHSQAQQLKAQMAAQQQAAVSASEMMRKAQKEAQKRLQAAIDAAAKELEKARQQQAKAEAVLQDACGAKWEERSADHQAKLNTCRQVKEDFVAIKAQQEVLKQTLKAQTTAANADQA